MKKTSRRLLGLAAAGIMFLSLLTVIKPLEDPPMVFAPKATLSVRA